MNTMSKSFLSIFIVTLFAAVFTFGGFSQANADWGSYGGSDSSTGSYSDPDSGSDSWSSYGGSDSNSSTCCDTSSSDSGSWSSYGGSDSTTATCSDCDTSSGGWTSYGGSDSITTTCSDCSTPPTTDCSYDCGGCTSNCGGCTTDCGGCTSDCGGCTHDCGCTHNCNPQPICELHLSPSKVKYGEDVVITWNTTNATAVSLSGFGTVSLDGSRTDSNIKQNKTYTLTATGHGKTVYCYKTVIVKKDYEKDLECKLKVSDSSIRKGDSVKLTWSSEGADYGRISPSVGRVDEDGSERVYPTKDTTYKGTFYNDDDEVTCTVKVRVDKDYVYHNPTPYINLSAVPYTGLELGPVGTALYWAFLVLWCLGAAYLIAIKRAHMSLYRWYKKAIFGEEIPAETSNQVSFASFSESELAKLASMIRNTVAGPAHSAPAAAPAPESEGTDPFILSQIHRNKRS